MSSTLERSDSEDLDHIPMADEGEETEDEAKDEVGGGGASNTGISSLLGDDRSLSPIRISDPDEAGTPAGGRPTAGRRMSGGRPTTIASKAGRPNGRPHDRPNGRPHDRPNNRPDDRPHNRIDGPARMVFK